MVRRDSQLLDDTARHALQPCALIDVVNDYDRILLFRIDAAWNHRRSRPRADQDRFEEIVIGMSQQRRHVVEGVHQIDSPRLVGPRLHRSDDVLVAQRKRMQELIPSVQGQRIHRDRNGRLAAVSEAMDHSVRTAPALGHIQHNEFPHAVFPVIAGQDCRDLGRAPRHLLRKEETVGIVRIAAVDGSLPGAVRIHRHQRTHVGMQQSGVIPAAVDHLTASQHRRV